MMITMMMMTTENQVFSGLCLQMYLLQMSFITCVSLHLSFIVQLLNPPASLQFIISFLAPPSVDKLLLQPASQKKENNFVKNPQDETCHFSLISLSVNR